MIDYENYTPFVWTTRQITKQFSKDTINKYGKIISFLYQNGFDLNCTDSEIEEQLRLFNYFQEESDLQELRKITNIESDYIIGKKIFVEEIYDILKENTYLQENMDSPMLIKSKATARWNDLERGLERIRNLFYCKDSEIVGVLKNISNLNDIYKRIDFIAEKMEKELKVLTWVNFSELIKILYSIYIQNGKIKTEQHKTAIALNLNDELYGGIGGYNSVTNEIKCIIGSAVYDVKSCKSGNKTKIKNIASAIFKETKVKEDEKEIKFLEKWIKNGGDDEQAQKIVVNCLLNGILILLILKHNINFLVDSKNSDRADSIKKEFLAIMNYCNIDKEYLI